MIPFKDRKIEGTKPVEVYRKLNNKCFSIRQSGVVVAHADNFTIDNVKPKISKAGRQRVIKEERKNVHTVIVGYNVSSISDIAINLKELDELYYDPYTLESFINKRTGERVDHCNQVYFYHGKAYIA